jgi:crotonobetainyl-CoA:carnitine CoA-transferase CaiB-like acyl-CoA transferase
MELAGSLGLEPIVEVDGSRQVAHPVRFSETPASYRHAPPALGSDQEVLTWLDQETAP